MADEGKRGVAGIVLAGGKSSRMGANKALMLYRGRPLVAHISALLAEAGCAQVYISGEVPGYGGIADAAPHSGPAAAMADLLQSMESRHERLLFVPVDMPLIQVKSLRHLMSYDSGAHYRNYPLPACVVTGGLAPCASASEPACRSVKEVLASAGTRAIALPPEWEEGMANINTKEQWEEMAS
jgi:molybdopterin-guanine dinucleotide biosynthesis protein A